MRDETILQSQEPPDLDQATALIRELLETDKAWEALTRFFRLRPPDQAEVMSELPRESQAELLSRMTARSLGPIIEELEPEEAVELSQDMEPAQLSMVLDETSPDVAADVLRSLPEELAVSTLEGMEEAEDVTPLLEYEDDDAGGLMTPEFIALRENMTVSQAMDFVRQHAEELDPEEISHLLIVDGNGVLRGGINLAQLVLARPYQRVALLMQPDPVSVPVETDQEECARLMLRYNLSRLTVADEDGKLVGVLKLEDMVDVIEEEATEDMYRMVGVREEEKPFGPFWTSVRNRLPWLAVNLGTLVVAGLVISTFESTLARVVALAAFLPVIAGQGGIAGTQTLTLIVRSLALGEISSANTKRLLLREIGLGLAQGLALAVIVGIVALLWKGSEYLALVVAMALVANMVVGAITGVLVPLGLKALRIDPALASAVAVTTATDIIGFLVYLGLASATITLIVDSI